MCSFIHFLLLLLNISENPLVVSDALLLLKGSTQAWRDKISITVNMNLKPEFSGDIGMSETKSASHTYIIEIEK